MAQYYYENPSGYNTGTAWFLNFENFQEIFFPAWDWEQNTQKLHGLFNKIIYIYVQHI